MKSLLFWAQPFVLGTTLLLLSFQAMAKNSYEFSSLSERPHPSYLLAQTDAGDDSYDPFADYSEFDENSDEEADINFFRNGRFFTVGFQLGMRGFTGELGKLYSSAPTYGLNLSYFFDLRLALELGFNTGDHDFKLQTATDTVTGNVSMTFINLNLKYYMNTQNVTRGLADLNPYIFGGFSEIYRTYTLDGTDGFGRDSTTGLNAGVGIEIPLLRRSAFFGVQAQYRYFHFKDEDSQMIIPATQNASGVYPKGDSFDIMGLLGLSF
jgi:hypothetical protein